jgi:hypothetical protein
MVFFIDYAREGSSQQMWSGYNGAQLGDPDKLGEVQVISTTGLSPLSCDR